MKQTLDQLANLYSTDKGTLYPNPSRHGYAPLYDTLLTKWREDPIRMLEIGIKMEFTEGGHSVNMWKHYFENAFIFTFDIENMHDHPAIKNNTRVSFFQGDQSNRTDLQNMYESFGNKDFDFILEDGSHQHHHQMISLGQLFKYVKSGGYYILEDMSIPNRPVCCIRNDETFNLIYKLKETGKIESEYLLPDEKEYLENNISGIEIYADIQNAYATAIITKK
jgi:hypothetical protein